MRLSAQAVDDSGSSGLILACAEEMPIPLYDSLAWAAQASGTLRAVITIGTKETPERIEVRGEPPILVERLKAALGKAKFSSACAGRRVEIRLIYRLEGAPEANLHCELKLRSGNTFEITARPPLPIPAQP